MKTYSQKEKLILAFKKALDSYNGGHIYTDLGSATIEIDDSYITAFQNRIVDNEFGYFISFGTLKEDISKEEFSELCILTQKKKEEMTLKRQISEKEKYESKLDKFLKL